MSEALRWLSVRLQDAPEHLRQRMVTALAEVDGSAEIEQHLAEAALLCLRVSIDNADKRECAFQLLAADALFTHASEAAMEKGSEALATFTNTWNAIRFESLLK